MDMGATTEIKPFFISYVIVYWAKFNAHQTYTKDRSFSVVAFFSFLKWHVDGRCPRPYLVAVCFILFFPYLSLSLNEDYINISIIWNIDWHIFDTLISFYDRAVPGERERRWIWRFWVFWFFVVVFFKKLFENYGQSHKVGHIEWARSLRARRWILCTGN